jgi:hypothetical protein
MKPEGSFQCIVVITDITGKRSFAPNLLNHNNDHNAAAATDLARKFKEAQAMHTQNGR